MGAKPYQQYWETQVQTASPLQLVVMLYDGLLRFLKQARNALAVGDQTGAHAGVARAVAILEHLAGTLNMDAGEVSQNLLRLYEFSLSRLLEAELHGDPAKVDEVIRVMEVLTEAWHHLAPGGVAAAGPRVGQPEVAVSAG